MSGLLAAVSSRLPKESRPPIVGQEVITFHELGFSISESHTTSFSKMESQETTLCCEAKESVDRPVSNCSETKRTESRNEQPSNPSPPPPYKWAQNLQCLLDDMQGVELFQRFLKQEGQDTRCLDFLFACRGVKKTAVEGEKLLKLVQVLYDKKVNRITAISDDTKREIKRRISSKVDVDMNIFDEAQRQVEVHIFRTTYPNFLESDLYIQHLGASRSEAGGECPVSPAEPECLPTLHEDSELHFSEKPPHFVIESFRRKPTRSAMMHLTKARSETGSYLKSSPYSAYHTKYGTFLPTSAQDSELQSLSSDAQTDDTSSVDYPLSRSKPKRMQKKGNMYMNKDDLNDFNFIPRTQRLEMEKKNTLDPHQLMKKLNKLADERNAKEQVYEKLRNIEASSKPCKPAAQVFDPNFFLQPSEDNCQDILDRHVSRVFDDSGETPVLSPVCASPPVSRPANETYDAAQDLSYTTSQKVGLASPFSVLSAAKHKREHDTRSSDSGAVTEWISDDNLAAGSRQTSALARMSREQSRRSCRRSCTVNDSASSCVDSGISEICEPVLHTHSKVAHWLEAKRCTSESEKDWKHSPTSPVLSQSSSSQKATAYRVGECVPNTMHNFTSLVSRSAAIQSQPFAQDLSMSAPDTTSNLIETRRRLEDDVRFRIAKSRHISGITKTRQSFRVSDVSEDGISHRKQSKKSSPGASENAAGNNDVTVIGYSYGQGAVPFLIRYQGKNVTLKNFKSLLSKKGNFKYYFKKVENAFGTGTVLEEVSDDHAILPLWEGKVFCVIETVDDVSTSTEEEKASQ